MQLSEAGRVSRIVLHEDGTGLACLEAESSLMYSATSADESAYTLFLSLTADQGGLHQLAGKFACKDV